MATINKTRIKRTHEGGKASHIKPLDELKRALMCCLLWENTFYESGESIADRIKNLTKKVSAKDLSNLAIYTRTKMKLRHAPLWLCVVMAEHGKLDGHTLYTVINRPDELTEFLALYWKDGKRPIPKQAKKGLAAAFNKFNEYSFAKYNRDGAVKLRDVLFMVHPKPENEGQQEIFNKIVNNELMIPDTWETNLSSGKDKKETWERLLKERKLGPLALLRNLRNMKNVGVDSDLVNDNIAEMNPTKVLPFRFIAAANYAPEIEDRLEEKMLGSLSQEKLMGKTVILVDVSGSMQGTPVSNRSDMDRLDAACGLAMVGREMCEKVAIYTFSQELVQLPPRRGFALRDLIKKQWHGGTYLGGAIKLINNHEDYDRIIIITDEQSHDSVGGHDGKYGYMINVAPYENGVSYGQYTHISGWSERIFDYIIENEKEI